MIALDTNILIALHRADSPDHTSATRAYDEAGGDHAHWSLPWPCVHEFLCIATHSRIFRPPSSLQEGMECIQRWRARPNVTFLHEDTHYWDQLQRLLREAQVSGPRVHDARIAALCLHHGISELWTADRDFSRFSRLRTRNPLVARG